MSFWLMVGLALWGTCWYFERLHADVLPELPPWTWKQRIAYTVLLAYALTYALRAAR